MRARNGSHSITDHDGVLRVYCWGAQAASLPHSAACRMHVVEFAPSIRLMLAASCRQLQAGSLCSPDARSLSWAQLGEELSLRLEPIGTGVAGEAESVAAFGDEVGASLDLFIRWSASRFWLRRLCRRLRSFCRSFFHRWPAGGRTSLRRLVDLALST